MTTSARNATRVILPLCSLRDQGQIERLYEFIKRCEAVVPGELTVATDIWNEVDGWVDPEIYWQFMMLIIPWAFRDLTNVNSIRFTYGLTKEQAVNTNDCTEFNHVTEKNADGTPLRCRVNGKCKTWKTRPAEFKLPVKHGLYNCFYITNHNAREWQLVPT